MTIKKNNPLELAKECLKEFDNIDRLNPPSERVVQAQSLYLRLKDAKSLGILLGHSIMTVGLYDAAMDKARAKLLEYADQEIAYRQRLNDLRVKKP